MHQQDKIDRLIANEDRQKKLAVIVTAVFLLAAVAIIVLSIIVVRQGAALTAQKRINQLLQDSISQARLLDQQFIAVTGADTIRSKMPDTSQVPLTQRPVADTAVSRPVASFVVYVQYARGAQEAQQLLVAALRRQQEYKVPGAELITNLEFGSSVRYFRQEDAAAAEALAAFATQVLATPFTTRYVSLKAPYNQLEIWIGGKN